MSFKIFPPNIIGLDKFCLYFEVYLRFSNSDITKEWVGTYILLSNFIIKDTLQKKILFDPLFSTIKCSELADLEHCGIKGQNICT